MFNREKVEQVRSQLQALKATAIEEGCDVLCYLIQVAEQEAEDMLSGRFTPGTQIEEFTPTTLQ
jgi:hypothetical protein